MYKSKVFRIVVRQNGIDFQVIETCENTLLTDSKKENDEHCLHVTRRNRETEIYFTELKRKPAALDNPRKHAYN